MKITCYGDNDVWARTNLLELLLLLLLLALALLAHVLELLRGHLAGCC